MDAHYEEKTKALKDVHLKIWYTTNKAFGGEVLDIRYGGMLARIQTAGERIKMYLNGEIEQIEELEGERLLYSIKYISSYTHSTTPASM